MLPARVVGVKEADGRELRKGPEADELVRNLVTAGPENGHVLARSRLSARPVEGDRLLQRDAEEHGHGGLAAEVRVRRLKDELHTSTVKASL